VTKFSEDKVNKPFTFPKWNNGTISTIFSCQIILLF
jgi:hypothetical protein